MKNASATGGYVFLHRNLLDHPRSKDAEWVALWVRILLIAQFEYKRTTFDGNVIELAPGQFISSRLKLAEMTGINRGKVMRLLDSMQLDGQIDMVPGNKETLYTVLNWRSYQNAKKSQNSWESDGFSRTTKKCATNCATNQERNGKHFNQL